MCYKCSCPLIISAVQHMKLACFPEQSLDRLNTHVERISEYYSNTYTYFTADMNASLAKPVDWLEQQDRWARKQVIPLHSPATFQSATVQNTLSVRPLSLDPGSSAYLLRQQERPASYLH